MKIDGKTRVWGLIGNPVEHTLSPLIQNTFASFTGVNAVYVPLGVREGLEAAIRGAHAFGFAGMNVTVPYKMEIMGLLSQIDEAAENVGAVNTLKYTPEGYKGYNTDVTGFVRELEKYEVPVAGQDVIVIGAGGASRAVCEGLRQLYVDHIYMLNRSVDKARSSYGEASDITLLGLDEYDKIPEGKYTCIQCTSVGLPGNENHAAIEDDRFYSFVETGVDLIYNPAETFFMHKVREQGGKAYNGLDMLVYQAVAAFETVHEVEISEEAVEKVYSILR